MTTKHTTSPWVVSEPNGRGNGYRISGCEAWLGYDRCSEETKANAYLIARAPLLFEENKQKQEIIDVLLEALIDLLNDTKRFYDSGDAGSFNCEEMDVFIKARAAIAQATT